MKLLKNALNKLIFNYNNYDGNKGNFQWSIKRKYPRLFNYIKSSFGKTFNEKIYCLLNDITKTPKCKQCSKKPVSFKNINEGFKTYCSCTCAHKDPDLHKIIQNSMLEKYGVSHALQIKEKAAIVSEKNKKQFSKDGQGRKNYEATMKKKYGVINPMFKSEFREKIKETHSKRTDDEIKKTVEKRKQTLLEKYNDENFNNSSKIQETLLKKYNVFHPNQLKCSKDWIAIKDKKKFLEEILPSTHPLKLAKDYNLAFSTVYKLINKFDLKNLVRKTFNAEYEIEKFIQTLGFKTKTNDRKILEGKEIDILVPEKNFGIEHNGIYWHSELKGKDKNYHLNKTKIAGEKGINLIHVFDLEWLEKEHIIKSIISKNLGIFEKKILASSCEIKEITIEEKNKFLEDNYIFGEDSFFINLGLFNKGELVSVMTFEHINKSNYKIHSHCDKINYFIENSEKHLFNYFINKFNPDHVELSLDRRYFNNVTLDEIGFKKIETEQPKPWYFGKDIDGLIDNNNMNSLNLNKSDVNRIWDCGQNKFEWWK